MPSGVQSPRKGGVQKDRKSGVQKDHKSAELALKKQKKIMRKATKVGPRSRCIVLSLQSCGTRDAPLTQNVMVLVMWIDANKKPIEIMPEVMSIGDIGQARYQQLWDIEFRFQKKATPADTEHLTNCAGCGLDTPPGVSDSTINWACCNKCHHWFHLGCLRPKCVHSKKFYKEIRDFPFTTSQDLEKDDDWICQFCLDPSLIMPPAHQQAEDKPIDLTV